MSLSKSLPVAPGNVAPAAHGQPTAPTKKHVAQTEVKVTVTDLPGRRWLTGDGFIKAEDGTVEGRVVGTYFGKPPQGLRRPTPK